MFWKKVLLFAKFAKNIHSNKMISKDKDFSPKKTFFTSDTHFFHKNIITYSGRPFISVEEMNEKLICNWNEVVPRDGVVFHLGDFCWGGTTEWNQILDRLNGTIYLILGNHDFRETGHQFMRRFAAVELEAVVKVGGRSILLNHFPFLSYSFEKDTGWQLFGHIHTNSHNQHPICDERLRLLRPEQYDVGVDNNNYRPISFVELERIIKFQKETGHRYKAWEDKTD